MARGRNPSNVEFLNKVKDVLQVGTVSEFAERCGQTTGNMSNYLSGQRTPGARVLRSCLKRLMAPERPQGVEFLRTLRRFSDAGTVSAFALACGKSAANMNAYLSGKSVPGTKVLRDCVHHLFSWQIEPLAEVAPLDEVDLPKAAGVYVLYDSSGSVLYVGQAAKFSAEVKVALSRRVARGMHLGPGLAKSTPKLGELACFVSLYGIHDARVRHNVEALLIRVFINQTHNRNLGNFV